MHANLNWNKANHFGNITEQKKCISNTGARLTLGEKNCWPRVIILGDTGGFPRGRN